MRKHKMAKARQTKVVKFAEDVKPDKDVKLDKDAKLYYEDNFVQKLKEEEELVQKLKEEEKFDDIKYPENETHHATFLPYDLPEPDYSDTETHSPLLEMELNENELNDTDQNENEQNDTEQNDTDKESIKSQLKNRRVNPARMQPKADEESKQPKPDENILTETNVQFFTRVLWNESTGDKKGFLILIVFTLLFQIFSLVHSQFS